MSKTFITNAGGNKCNPNLGILEKVENRISGTSPKKTEMAGKIP